MRYLRCSYTDLLLLPDGYVPVIEDIARREAEAREREEAHRALRARQLG